MAKAYQLEMEDAMMQKMAKKVNSQANKVNHMILNR
jgi:hypothetical protein